MCVWHSWIGCQRWKPQTRWMNVGHIVRTNARWEGTTTIWLATPGAVAPASLGAGAGGVGGTVGERGKPGILPSPSYRAANAAAEDAAFVVDVVWARALLSNLWYLLGSYGAGSRRVLGSACWSSSESSRQSTSDRCAVISQLKACARPLLQM